MKTVIHMTTAHPRDDVRIFHKEVISLSYHYKVCLLVADGLGDAKIENVDIFDMGKPANRLERFFQTTRKMLRFAQKMDADLYHLHDPDLLLIVSRLKKLRGKVVFDAHEDLPKQILSKPYLKKWQALVLSKIIAFCELKVARKLTAVVAATDSIRQKFLVINQCTYVVNNYPFLKEFYPNENHNRKYICYIGGISKVRGVREMVSALAKVQVSKRGKLLLLAGSFSSASLKEEIENLSGYSYVKYLGQVNREELREVLAGSLAGVVLFAPEPNHIESQPNKLFEYMSAGIAVIASDFPLWKEIIKSHECGICVDPQNIEDISKAMNYILENADKALEMGSNGRKAVVEKYNWEMEVLNLYNLYQEII